ncbi:hypothetical protein PGT21_005737 [Puccinia graminis f. sp. tritici]|uniref:Uncharacterized protein n=1 Tax=Puccinia graminis f. sp. tritici TaxID=56615 RepID=A0A5B0RXM9_PUCGR|nr:hypothetical protein PGT21_005737 [Puccinia graminis f. sp. tritici]KAA1130377.1 hypothetical protein PGTUg99_006731 [Puccinia graminis f. sp. tritici]
MAGCRGKKLDGARPGERWLGPRPPGWGNRLGLRNLTDGETRPAAPLFRPAWVTRPKPHPARPPLRPSTPESRNPISQSRFSLIPLHSPSIAGIN